MPEDPTYRYRAPYKPPEAMGRGPLERRREVRDDLVVERDVAVALRDDTLIYVDVFRPLGDAPVPPIIAWSPYGKHGHVDYGQFPGSDVSTDMVSSLTAFEAPDPTFWAAAGYAVVTVDPRGLWRSEGNATYCSPDEARDFHDLVEWAGTQEWSNGRVGLSGVSYLAVAQWQVAAQRPPHLAAINPWEGWTDLYREVVRHGGMRETRFWPFLIRTWGFSEQQIEDLLLETKERETFDEYWASKVPDLEAIDVPAFVVACWADQGLHLRGTLAGFERIASEHKWLEVHGGKKWAHYYTPENMERLERFFARFLKGEDDGSTHQWPRVQVEVRERYLEGDVRDLEAWPPPSEPWTLHLDAASGGLSEEAPQVDSQTAYDSLGSGAGEHRAVFEHVFETRTDLIGPARARLAMSCEAGDDLDVFVALIKRDRSGRVVPFAYYGQFDDGPVALGWLRASHRELDEAASTTLRPVHTHRRKVPVPPREIVTLDVEIWPSGTRFEAGERLELIVQGTDVFRYGRAWRVQTRHEESVNHGTHRLHTGPADSSYLVLPRVPTEPRSVSPCRGGR